MARLKHRGEQSQTEKEFCDILRMADPIVSRFVSEHEAFRARNEALLERVTVLEQATENAVAMLDVVPHTPESLVGRARMVLREALDG